MELFKNLIGATPQTKRVLETFGKVVKKKVGMDVSIDISVDASKIGTKWFNFDVSSFSEQNTTARKSMPRILSGNDIHSLKESTVVFNTESITKEINGWDIDSKIQESDCKAKKAFAIAYYLANNKENGKFVKRHFKEICFVDNIVGNAINIDNFKMVVDEKALKLDHKIFDPSEGFEHDFETIIRYLRENIGIRASIKKMFNHKDKK